MKLSQRSEYAPKKDLLSGEITKNPLELFKEWYQKAEKENLKTANIMHIATVDKNNAPSQRIVLLREIENEKLIFYSNYQSKKGKDLTENKNICGLFYWENIDCQVQICGYAEKVSREKSVEYFQSRPLANRISAIVSKQSQPMKSYNNLLNQVNYLRSESEKNKDKYDFPPEHWGGYAITPTRWEFWQGQPSRLHHRISYERLVHEDDWKIQRLYP